MALALQRVEGQRARRATIGRLRVRQDGARAARARVVPLKSTLGVVGRAVTGGRVPGRAGETAGTTALKRGAKALSGAKVVLSNASAGSAPPIPTATRCSRASRLNSDRSHSNYCAGVYPPSGRRYFSSASGLAKKGVPNRAPTAS